MSTPTLQQECMPSVASSSSVPTPPVPVSVAKPPSGGSPSVSTSDLEKRFKAEILEDELHGIPLSCFFEPNLHTLYEKSDDHSDDEDDPDSANKDLISALHRDVIVLCTIATIHHRIIQNLPLCK